MTYDFVSCGYLLKMELFLTDATEPNQVTVLGYFWDDGVNDWYVYFKSEETYDEFGDRILYIDYAWNSEIEEWILSEKIFEYYNTAITTEVINETSTPVALYPNPTNSYLYISATNWPIEIRLFSIHGIEIMKEKIWCNPLNISDVPQAVYILTISKNEKLLLNKKIIKK